jgi:hypothetical protein
MHAPADGACVAQELPQDPADVLAVAQQIAAFAFSSKARARALRGYRARNAGAHVQGARSQC